MKKFALCLLLTLSYSVFSQTESGDLEDYLQTILGNMPGDSGDNYTIPNNSDITSWENCVSNLLSGDLSTARSHANDVNYEIVLYTDTAFSASGTNYYVLKEKSSANNYWGTYVFPEGTTTNDLVLQAPHSSHDFNTGKQAIYSFVRLNSFALFLNGTHRCNHSQASTCSGTTSVCSGSSEAFKVSDLAHNTNSVYQKTTELVHDNFSNTVFIQLHGFTKLPTDPYVILSNGTDQAPSGTDYALDLKNALFSADPTLTFKIAHIDNWTRLVGFTNTQGRYINQSTNVCNLSATSSTGRFVHLEQEKSKLREDVTGWNKLYVALDQMFNQTAGIDEIINLNFTSKNPFEDRIEFSADYVETISLFTLSGVEIYSYQNRSGKSEFNIDTKYLASGVYLLKVMTSKGIISKKLLRE